MLFANASKIIRNWFLTLQPDNYLQFIKVGTRKCMDVTWVFDAISYICLCSNLCTYLFMHLYEIKNSFIKIPEAININFWLIWQFDVKGTGWVGLELSIIFMQNVGRLDM